MSVRCSFLLLHGVILMSPLPTSASLIPGAFTSCFEASCTTSLANRLCAVENNLCKCEATDSSACGTLNQKAFVNITGASNESSSQWSCCFCSSNASYCCTKCSMTTVPPEVILPTRYDRIILVFLLECKQLNDDNENLKISLEQGIARLTRLPLESIKVNESNCMTGQRPYCGVDVETIRAHQRARRLVGGRVSGKRTKNKNKERSSYSLYHRNIDLTCEALSANITVSGKNLTLLEMSLDLLKHLQANNSLIIPLWDERVLYSSFMLSAIDGSSYSLHEAPETEPPPPLPTKNVPPLEVNLTPMIYAGASIVGLITLCVLWKFIKHSWLLYRKRFTPINSDRVDRKKVLQRQRIMEAMEENHYPPPQKGSAFVITTDTLPLVDNEGITLRNNWSSARSLAPAYKPTKLHNQRTPPKLVLDDEESAIERRSVDSAMMKLVDDENLSDILNSDDEKGLRRLSGSSQHFQGIGNPAFIDEEDAKVTAEEDNKSYNNNLRKKTTSSRSANGSIRSGLVVDNSVSREERKASLASSDLSVEAEERTVFLPLKNDKTKKKDSARQKKSKMLLSPSVPKKNNRRLSITPLDEDDMTGNKSKKENTKNNLLTTENAQDGARRKSVSTPDDEVMIVTPKDRYMEGRRSTKGYAFENSTKPENEVEENENAKVRNERLSVPDKGRRKSMIDGEEHRQSFGKKGTKRKESLIVPAAQSNGRRKSLIVDREDVRNTGSKDVKASESLIAPVGERRKSLIASDHEDPKTKTSAKSTREGKRASLAVDEEDMEESGKSRNKKTEEAILFVDEDGKSTGGQKSKRKKKKVKKGKKAKKKVDDLDELSDLEEVISASPKELTHSDGIQPTPEIPQGNSITVQDKETKKKKKKRKQKEPVVTKKPEDSELSDEDVEDKIKEINANTLDPEIGQRKKKKQKNAKGSRKKSLNPTTMPSDDEINGDFRKSGNDVRAESTAIHTEKRRKKPSLTLEDMEIK